MSCQPRRDTEYNEKRAAEVQMAKGEGLDKGQ